MHKNNLTNGLELGSKKDITKSFNDLGLRITIPANLKTINFHDVTLNLHVSIYYINAGTLCVCVCVCVYVCVCVCVYVYVCVCVCLFVSVRPREPTDVSPHFFRRRKEILLTSYTNCFPSLYDAWFERKSVWSSSTGYTLELVHESYTFRLP